MNTVIAQGHLGKVRIDLADTNKALSAWWDEKNDLAEQVAILHTAAEAMMRAVSTLTQVVEDAQRVEPAPTVRPTGWMFS